MNLKSKKSLLYFALELLIYGGMVVGYLFVVLHLLSEWILQINEKSRQLYAVLSLLLIVGQGMILESVTTALLQFIRRGKE